MSEKVGRCGLSHAAYAALSDSVASDSGSLSLLCQHCRCSARLHMASSSCTVWKAASLIKMAENNGLQLYY